jgi:phosphoribosyl 1,2-cyclic phosphodiesterase
MKLTFLGTRGYIEPSSRRHRRHTSTLVSYRGRRVLLDYGADWEGKAGKIRPRAIVITHAHPDHAFGLRAGAPCPVYATRQSWELLKRFPLPPDKRRVIRPRRSTNIEGMSFEAFPVVHSTRAPAVGYRITAGRASLFYVPDVVRIHHVREALSGIRVYVGDGARIDQPLLRRDARTGSPVGHTSIAAQLGWCARHGVSRMIVTHCGSAIVRGNERGVRERLRILAEERGVELEVAEDGMEYVVP